jgi:alpha-glucosidase
MTNITETAPRPALNEAAAPWWRQAVVYQIYPRSFADAKGDGIGDLRGIISRIDYLEELGIDAVWLSPFYPLALADGGYDVDDYRDVDPKLGTLADFDDLVTALHEVGIRIVVDIVPNHSSNRHVWFQEALATGRSSAARERYFFRDGLGPDGAEPPADWRSSFGGPAWTRVADGQWYYHNFAPEQPDLNWANPEVREDFLETLRFWSDRGVDGFRVDVANGVAKRLPDPLPTAAELAAMPWDGNHPLWDRAEVLDIYREWRAVLNEYDPPRSVVAEAWVHKTKIPRYANPETLGQAFNFDLLRSDFDPTQFREIVSGNLTVAKTSGSSSTWVLSNHDHIRHATRYDLQRTPSAVDDKGVLRRGLAWLLSGGKEPVIDRASGLRRARAATLFLLGLPGSTYLYQGEELGLHEVAEIPPEARQDPTFLRTNGAEIGRDGCRVPLPWTRTGISLGFGAGRAHLPQPPWFAESAVEVQEGDPSSTLSLYRRALALRHTLQTEEGLEWVETDRADVLRFRRPNGWEVVMNFGTEPFALDRGEVVLASADTPGGVVQGEATVWIAPSA